MIASKLSSHCDVISNRLWRHHQNHNRAGETRGRCVQIVVFIVINVYRSSFLSSLMDSVCRVRNKIMFLRSFECYYFDVYFPHCIATREINTKIILSWALKQFVTRVHKLFSIYTIVAGTVWTCTSSKLLYRFPLIYVVAFVSCQEVMVYVEPQGIWAPSQYKDRLIYVWWFPC